MSKFVVIHSQQNDDGEWKDGMIGTAHSASSADHLISKVVAEKGYDINHVASDEDGTSMKYGKADEDKQCRNVAVWSITAEQLKKGE